MTYCIYHIPGVKIGVTNNVKYRVEQQQGYTEDEYEILEMSDDIRYISKKELYLQKLHGYRIDEKPYNKLKCNQMKINVTEMTTTFPCPVVKLKGRLMDNIGMSWDTPFGECTITNKSIEWIMSNVASSQYTNDRCYVYNRASARWFDNNNAHEIRTGGIHSDTVGNITERVSKEFDKDVDLRQKLDLARIESELKKEQIREQAIATDPIAIEKRKRALSTIGDLDRADRGGVRYGTKNGIKLLALDYEDLTGNTYQGSLGGEDKLKQLQGTEAYKLNPESVIKDSIENIKIDGVIKPGANGTYTIGNELYEYVNGVVRRLK